MVDDRAVERLIELSAMYADHGGSYRDHSTRIGSGWARVFPGIELGPVISRRQLLDGAVSAAGDEQWSRVFIATMAWGYGTGYGAFRTGRLAGWPGTGGVARLGSWLGELARLSSRGEGPVGGYEWLQRNRMKGLGPAFATKLLYVASPSHDRAPIIDSVVASWLHAHGVETGRSRFGSRFFDADGYRRFIGVVDAAQKAVSGRASAPVEARDRGFVEYLMFQDQLRAWGKVGRLEPWISGSRMG